MQPTSPAGRSAAVAETRPRSPCSMRTRCFEPETVTNSDAATRELHQARVSQLGGREGDRRATNAQHACKQRLR